jgi:hypothetical protein
MNRDFNEPNRPHNGDDASRAAAESVSVELAAAQVQQILDLLRIRGRPGATCDEVEMALSTLAARARVTRGPDFRKTRSGRSAGVYRLAVKTQMQLASESGTIRPQEKHLDQGAKPDGPARTTLFDNDRVRHQYD